MENKNFKGLIKDMVLHLLDESIWGLDSALDTDYSDAGLENLTKEQKKTIKNIKNMIKLFKKNIRAKLSKL